MATGRRLGGPSTFLLLLFLLPWDTLASTAEPQYLVMVPFLIHTETSENICVQLSHLNESVTLSITLEYGAENTSLIRDIVGKEDVFECVPFQLPRWEGSSASPQLYLTVLVKGATLHFWSRKSVLVKNQESLVFVQTDKPIYRAEQKVQFRIVSLDEHFRPLNEKFPLVYIQDPKRNRLAQWLDVELNMGLTQLSFPLTSEPALGTYRVMVQKSCGNFIQYPFNVDEYVLPRFEVSVTAPKVLTIMADKLEVTACGRYTYGKPVAGLVNISVCRPYYSNYRGQCHGRESQAVCEEFSGEADRQGCFSQVVKTKVFQLKRAGYQMNIDVEGKITEEGTGVVLTGTASTEVTATLSTITLQRMDKYYRPGMPIWGQMLVKDGTNKPITNATVEIRSGSYKSNHITDDQGQAQFSIDTANFTDDSITFEASYKSSEWCDNNWISPRHQSAHHTVSRFYSPSQSYLQTESVPGTLSCGQSQLVQVHYALNLNAMSLMEIEFHFLMMARGNYLRSGTHVLPVEKDKAKGVFSLNLSADVNSAPVARLLVYTVLPSGELVAHSADFTVENCFANTVRLEFREPKGLPASNTSLHLSVSRPSLCAIHAVDKSVFLLKPEAELSPQTVYNLLPVKTLRGYHYDGQNLEEPNFNPCIPAKKIIVKGIRYYPEPFSYNEGDSYEILKDFGLKVFTSTKIHKPDICAVAPSSGRFEHYAYGGGYSGLATPGISAFRRTGPLDHIAEDREAEKPARSLFPETWLWDLLVVNGPEQKGDGHTKGQAPMPGDLQGQIDIPVTIPDTITEWKAGAFCLSTDAGFGLAQSASLTVFQPFFVEVTLPYSVVRGEVFQVKVSVFNYLKSCMRVHVTLALSDDFDASPVEEEEEEESHCLCANERKTISWNVTPKSLGEVNFTASAEALQWDHLCGNELVVTPSKGQKDTVIKSLLVEPEGIERDVALNSLLCADGNSKSAPVSLKLPENVVEGSARATHCVLGDILGGAIQNLQQLIQMPYGCGEQNMARFAPNIYIMDYLNETGQLTEEIRSKITGYLVDGYQRQLNYKHSDGSYSTFGQRSQETGNTWLTAFVLKCFAQVRPIIFVEERHITEALASLAIRQKENGCFQSTGTLLNNALKGGVDDEVTLSTYITTALLEMPLPVTHSVVRNALFCLETAAQAKDVHVYTRALMAYAFALAGKEDQRREALHILEGEAVKEEDGSVHWQRPEKPEQESDFPYYWPRAPSAEVEMTAYVLLAVLTKKPAPSQEDLDKGTNIVRWLSKQQNPTGGFSSTQDTVVALQALSRYATSIYPKGRQAAEVTLASGGKRLSQFQVASTNRLLLQCQSLPTVPGDYDVQVAGHGCVYLQTTLKYNVQPHQEHAPFALDVHTVPETCAGTNVLRTFDIAINVSYTGKRSVSNMAIVDVKMLSGVIPVKSSVRKLQNQEHIKRTEVTSSHVLLYLDQVTNVTQSFSFTVERDVPVQGLKAAVVSVYDYYETDEAAYDKYSAPCSPGDTKQGNA